MLWSTVLKVGDYNLLLKFQVMKRLNIRTEGVSSRIPGTSLHVTFLDYDNIDDERLREELEHVIDVFEIGSFIVLSTRETGRHCICLDALRFRDVMEIVDFTSCDLMFKRAPRINEYRCWVLRYEKKGDRKAPEYLYTVESPYEGNNLQSAGHAKYLLKFGVERSLKNPFGPEEIETQEYNTAEKHVEETSQQGTDTEEGEMNG